MEMREFKRLSSQRGLPISPSASVLYLWTEAGCLYHCKLINTQSAWQVFGELVRVYFAAKGAPLDSPLKEKLFMETANLLLDRNIF